MDTHFIIYLLHVENFRTLKYISQDKENEEQIDLSIHQSMHLPSNEDIFKVPDTTPGSWH